MFVGVCRKNQDKEKGYFKLGTCERFEYCSKTDWLTVMVLWWKRKIVSRLALRTTYHFYHTKPCQQRTGSQTANQTNATLFGIAERSIANQYTNTHARVRTKRRDSCVDDVTESLLSSSSSSFCCDSLDTHNRIYASRAILVLRIMIVHFVKRKSKVFPIENSLIIWIEKETFLHLHFTMVFGICCDGMENALTHMTQEIDVCCRCCRRRLRCRCRRHRHCRRRRTDTNIDANAEISKWMKEDKRLYLYLYASEALHFWQLRVVDCVKVAIFKHLYRTVNTYSSVYRMLLWTFFDGKGRNSKYEQTLHNLTSKMFLKDSVLK